MILWVISKLTNADSSFPTSCGACKSKNANRVKRLDGRDKPRHNTVDRSQATTIGIRPPIVHRMHSLCGRGERRPAPLPPSAYIGKLNGRATDRIDFTEENLRQLCAALATAALL